MNRLSLKTPGLFITATGTEVGKTVVTCAIARALGRAGKKVGVSKPIASGCRRDRGGLVNEDAEALAHFSDTPETLEVVNPIRFHDPVAPAVALDKLKAPLDTDAIATSLQRIADHHEVLLVEGVGGVMVPLDRERTVIDLMQMIGYPVVVVTGGTLGTLNHTALTCKAITDAGLTLAGLVVNRYRVDSADPSTETNLRWLAQQNKTELLAVCPDVAGVDVAKGMMPDDLVDAVGQSDWARLARPSIHP